MKFRVIKSSMDGMCGGNSLLSIEDALREIGYIKGWDTRKQLETAVKRWAKTAAAGSVFTTAASAIVCAAELSGGPADECPECLSDSIGYEDFQPNEDGLIEQIGECKECGYRWQDVFSAVKRNELCRAS